ncbi:MAG: class I SAM-dependent methyltransferase [Clostridia bacterium]|nr:class I SAM-dependent methyltransferase [Clostridia bacterium]
MTNKRQFTVLAEYYDMLNGADYSAYAEYVDKTVRQYGGTDNKLTLDLGCGTGSLTFELARQGYDMIGADLSAEMLGVAMDRAYDYGFTDEKSILFLRQDMRSFELYGTVGTIVCALDGINYLPSLSDVKKCFSLVHNYLEEGGIFIFDVNTPFKFKNVFAKRDFFTEDGSGEVYMGWKSRWHEKTSACDFDLTLFIRNDDGSYERREETQTEYMWTAEQLCSCISDSGMELIAIHKDLSGTKSIDALSMDTDSPKTEEKWFFVCKRTKPHCF